MTTSRTKTEIDPVEFSLYPKRSYNEEYQRTGFHYAFMSPDNKMCHGWVKCRDFLQDALRNQLTGRADEIYSFKYDPESDPEVATEQTSILVKRLPVPDTDEKKSEFDNMIMAGLKLVNYYEKAHKLGKASQCVRASHKGQDQYVYLFRGPGVWSQGPIMISLYTFLIRLGYFLPEFKDEKSLMDVYDSIINHESQDNDCRYLKTIHKHIHTVLKYKKKHLFKQKGKEEILFSDTPMNTFHHNSGIVSLSMLKNPEKKINDEFKKLFEEE